MSDADISGVLECTLPEISGDEFQRLLDEWQVIPIQRGILMTFPSGVTITQLLEYPTSVDGFL